MPEIDKCHREPPWPLSGYTFQAIQRDFYDPQMLTYNLRPENAVCDKMQKISSEQDRCAPDGVRLVEIEGELVYNPVSIAQYALYHIGLYRQTGNPAHLQTARANANKLLEMAEHNSNALWFPYNFDFALAQDDKNTIHAPWYSAMAQGQALSVFSRMSQIEPDNPTWASCRDAIFRSFAVSDRLAGPFTLSFDNRKYVWFEEHAGDTAPMLVINGQIFAIFGLYDYWQATADSAALPYLDGGVTTVRDAFPRYRDPGKISNYCTQLPLCTTIKNPKYHMIHINQLLFLHEMTGDVNFKRQAEQLRSDYNEVNAETGRGITW